MQFSQEEFVESSQKSSVSRGRRRGRPFGSATSHRTLRSKTANAAVKNGGSRPRTQERNNAFEISESNSLDWPRDSEDVANLSASLFEGQHDLLQQYERTTTDRRPKPKDDLIERVLEQSRQAYEQLRLQTEQSQNHGSSQNKSQNCGSQWLRVDRLSPANEPVIQRKEVAVQMTPKVDKRISVNASVQVTPVRVVNPIKTSTGTNTDIISRGNSSIQTSPKETRNVAVQKYHSVRMRDSEAQTSGTQSDPPQARKVSRRNVCIQQRSSDLLEINNTNVLRLGLEMKCDPANLHRIMRRVASCQRSGLNGSGIESAALWSINRRESVKFTEEDPYFVNYDFFMKETDGDKEQSESEMEFDDQFPSCYVQAESLEKFL
ncbi:uncharacterized protein LOC129756490 [Uranotaenia lowii]|uniref:uncharacterized protein LOC129756490 n=1 Tax=Uranotaenia lowii TaxID=190385 RepID=UPI002478C1E7|nr:uncharacterized protein LOC129756490 [Uranotaenia lowii]